MIVIPEDPVQVWINRLHRLALTLMDETVIIRPGMSSHPNDIEAEGILYESLPNEDVINRRVAQYRSPLLLACEVTTLYLFKTRKRLDRATRLASNR